MSSMRSYAKDWHVDLLGGQGLGERSAREYLRHVEGLLPFLAQVLVVPEDEVPVSVSRSDLAKAVAAWRFAPDARYSEAESAPKEKSPLTVGRRLSALRSFFDWCVEEGHVSSSPARRLKSPPAPVRTPVAVSREVVSDVVAGAKMSRAPERDLLLVLLLVTCGLSLEEVASLPVVPAGSSRVRVVSRSRARTVALSPAAVRALDAYLLVRQELLIRNSLTSGRLLLAMRPRVDRVTGETTLEPRKASLLEALERTFVRAGLDVSGMGSHALRVAFARAALQDGSHSVATLQQQLGHVSLSSLRVWAGDEDGDLGTSAARHPFADID